jgi:ketosteroid isomerase-like protein
MTYLSEDPTYLAGGLFLLAATFAIALKVTQQGKYLVWASVAGVLALAVILIEWMWVTDSERIEHVVYDVRTAVVRSDVDGVLSHLTPDITYSGSESSRDSEATRALISGYVSSVQLEFARISDLKISVGEQTRRGSAEFRVFAKGGFKTTSSVAEGRTAVSAWSMGFRETEPGVWKIYRISPIALPDGIRGILGGSRRAESSPRQSGRRSVRS